MRKADWLYNRSGCETCLKARTYFENRKINLVTVVDCKKQPMLLAEAKHLLAGVEHLYATKGTKVFEVELSDKPSDEALGALLIGPSGKLRAPVVKHGKYMLVGFNEAMYDKVFSVSVFGQPSG